MDGGGQGLDEFRETMLADKRMREPRRLPERCTRCFPGVEIKGGVCYFLWDRDNDGPCDVTTMSGRASRSGRRRSLPRRVRHPRSATTRPCRSCEKVLAQERAVARRRVSSRTSRSADSQLRRIPRKRRDSRATSAVKLYRIAEAAAWVRSLETIPTERQLIDKWKVLIRRRVQGDERGQSDPTVSSARRSSPSPAPSAPRPTSLLVRSTPRARRRASRRTTHAVRPLPRLAAQDHPGRHAATSTPSFPT